MTIEDMTFSPWAGGNSSPVPPGVSVYIKERSGEFYLAAADEVPFLRWYHTGRDTDIVGFRVAPAVPFPASASAAADHAVNHPKHYTSHPSGIEAITVCEHMGFNLGNAVKYLWRADLKHDTPAEDLEKAIWYIRREIDLRQRKAAA